MTTVSKRELKLIREHELVKARCRNFMDHFSKDDRQEELDSLEKNSEELLKMLIKNAINHNISVFEAWIIQRDITKYNLADKCLFHCLNSDRKVWEESLEQSVFDNMLDMIEEEQEKLWSEAEKYANEDITKTKEEVASV